MLALVGAARVAGAEDAATGGGPATPAGSEPWKRVAFVEGVEVLALPTRSGFDLHRARVPVCTDLETAATFTEDADHFEDWVAYTLEARLLERSDERVLYYLKNSAPWPVRPRDMIYELSPRFDDSGALHISMLGLPEHLPEEPGVVRMDSVEGEWLFVPEAAEVSVQLTIHVQPGRRVPKFLANRRLAQSVGRTLAGLARNFPCATSRDAVAPAPGR